MGLIPGRLRSAAGRYGAALLVPALLLVQGCEPSTAPVRTISGPTMGTTYTVTVVSGRMDDTALRAGVEAVLARVNDRMSTYREDTELSRFNRARTTDWFPVSEETARVVLEALRVSRLSDGAFDVTVGPLVNLWGFGPGARPERVPDASEIARTRERVGFRKLHARLAPPALRKDHPALYVDLSGIAKGYAVDAVAALLERGGETRYLVEVGGELRGLGSNPSGVPWRIAVERPSTGERAAVQVIALARGGVATSGDYRNYFEEGGRRFSHTLVPATGRPIAHRLASVTVLHPSAMTADALATALMVLGPDEGFGLARRENLAALFIRREGDAFTEQATRGFETSAGGTRP